MQIETKYAKSGDVHIAYQVVGQGPLDLVWVPGWVSHLDHHWRLPSLARYLRRLASFSRLILFDKRGTGLSDPVVELPTLEQRMDDVRAVMDAVGSERAAVLGTSEGGCLCALFAATYPERTTALILYGAWAKRLWSEDYPWAPTLEARTAFLDTIERDWGREVDLSTMAPSAIHDERFMEWWGPYLRLAASPGAALTLARINTQADIRHVLPAIRVPTLVIHRTGDRDALVEEGRYLAEHIPGATFVEVPGIDHLQWVGDQDAILDPIEAFLTGVPQPSRVDQVLATLLAIELASAGARGARLDDSRWRELTAAQDAVIDHEVRQHRGKLVGRTGNNVLVTFDGPTRALRCATFILDGMAQLGTQIRAGLHTGECELLDGDVGGEAVQNAARVMELAGPGEILASSTVRGLVAGPDIEFNQQDVRLSGGPLGGWRLFRVRRASHAPGASGPGVAQPASRARHRGKAPTTREREVAMLLAEGLTNRQIADKLTISTGTAERHVANILNKLGFRTRAQIAAWAGEQGLLSDVLS